jgi:hypothetical protein
VKALSLGLAASIACFASTASADPPEEQAQPDPSAPTQPEQAPAPQPAAEPPPAPALTIGGSPVQAPSDTPAKPPPRAAGAEPRPWVGSALYNQNSISTGTIFGGQQLYRNATVESNLFFLPRYEINRAFQLRARTVLTYEYTNNDSSTYRNEPLLSDTTLQLFYRSIPKVLGFQPAVAVGAALPTSKLSRARTMIFTPSALVQVSRPIERFFGGEALILSTVAYGHPIYRAENPVVTDARPPGAFACVGGNNCQDLLGGSLNPSDTLSYSFLFEAEWGKWSPALFYLGATQWAYRPTEAANPVDGRPIERPAGFEPTSVRQTHYFSAWLDYNFNSWFTGEVGFWNSVQGLDASGQRSNIFFDRYQDTRVYLGCSIQLDNLVRTLQGGEEGEAGVVRARNKRSPIGFF